MTSLQQWLIVREFTHASAFEKCRFGSRIDWWVDREDGESLIFLLVCDGKVKKRSRVGITNETVSCIRRRNATISCTKPGALLLLSSLSGQHATVPTK